MDPVADLTVTELTTLVRQQQQRIEQLEGAVQSTPLPARGSTTDVDGRRTSRRTMLRRGGTLGVAAAGAAVGAFVAPSHAAAAGEGADLQIGGANTATSGTSLTLAPGSTIFRNGFTVTDLTETSGFPSAIGGHGFGKSFSNGVYGFANHSTNQDNTGHALVSVVAGTARSNLIMKSDLGPPTDDTNRHAAGELRTDNAGSLWYCTTSGAPGDWQRLAGPNTQTLEETSRIAGVMLLLAAAFPATKLNTPFRVYDSRLPMAPLPTGRLSTGSSRVLAIHDAREVDTGAVKDADAVDQYSSGLIYTIAAIRPTGSGFLSVSPGDSTEVNASTINFDPTSPTVQVNTGSVSMSAGRELNVIAGGAPGGSCDFTIDVVGTYLDRMPFINSLLGGLNGFRGLDNAGLDLAALSDATDTSTGTGTDGDTDRDTLTRLQSMLDSMR